MRQFTTDHTVYEFDELSKEAQETAISNYRDGEDYPWLSDDMSNTMEALLKKNKITYEFTPNVYYSLSYSQGDGAMIEGTVKWKAWTATIKHSGLYYHYNSKDITLESTKTGKEADQKTYDQFNDIYVEICKELERAGYAYIEEATSDENIAQFLREMDYEFYEDGRSL